MFYSMPTKPEKNRIRIWRRLQKEGTLLYNGAHILPYTEDHVEFFQWLSKEIKMVDGEMSFAKIETMETIRDDELIKLFIAQAESSYDEVAQKVESLQMTDDSVLRTNESEVKQAFKKVSKEFDELRKIDFFDSRKGVMLSNALKSFQHLLDTLFKPKAPLTLPTYDSKDFQNKQWLTRPKPFVDRMASAWLIRTFIDPDAEFVFGKDDASASSMIGYDMDNAMFTHIGDLCTFEVMMGSFGITDPAVLRIAQIVHNLDLNDDKYAVPEADGLFAILSGIRSSDLSDEMILLCGADIFESLYRHYKKI